MSENSINRRDIVKRQNQSKERKSQLRERECQKLKMTLQNMQQESNDKNQKQ